jgi:3-deoxy-7-phosphoheptulonate synthase
MSTALAGLRAETSLGRVLPSPRELRAALPSSDAAEQAVQRGRSGVRRIIEGSDPRLLAIVGPCSIHNTAAALEYARRLRRLASRCRESLHILMRVYLEKPRTTIGWRGLLMDPRLDGSGRVDEGLWGARELLVRIAELGLPAAAELVDPLVAPYIRDLLSWIAIGARTCESQIHRELASSLPMPAGFKNSTDGNMTVAVNAMLAASRPWHRVTLDDEGRPCVQETTGNAHPHLVLRGSEDAANCGARGLIAAGALLEARGFAPIVIVDCSHGNSRRDASRQERALRCALAVRHPRAAAVVGFMLESNLATGCQRCDPHGGEPAPELSITDPCLGWEETEGLLLSLRGAHSFRGDDARRGRGR